MKENIQDGMRARQLIAEKGKKHKTEKSLERKDETCKNGKYISAN